MAHEACLQAVDQSLVDLTFLLGSYVLNMRLFVPKRAFQSSLIEVQMIAERKWLRLSGLPHRILSYCIAGIPSGELDMVWTRNLDHGMSSP